MTTKTEWEVLPTSWKTQVIVCDQLCDIKTGSSDASHEASFFCRQNHMTFRQLSNDLFSPKFDHDMRVHVTGILLERIFANFV